MVLHDSSVGFMSTITVPYPHSLLSYRFYIAHSSLALNSGALAVTHVRAIISCNCHIHQKNVCFTIAETHDEDNIYMCYKA